MDPSDRQDKYAEHLQPRVTNRTLACEAPDLANRPASKTTAGLCVACRQIFSCRQSTSQLQQGVLSFDHTRLSMISSALQGCVFCRELLCVKPDHTWKLSEGGAEQDIRRAAAEDNDLTGLAGPMDL